MNIIPAKVQCLLSASNQIKSLNKVVEELVYNSLDAEATSIAIRINVQESTIQVIDNGCGVWHKDFYSIGQEYMTSKFVDLSTLKSLPNKYGFRGQSLANIVNLSKSVKVISRHEKSEVTWMKLFEQGDEKQIKIYDPRPSKGTTVEVSGFLYNQNAWNKSKDSLCELQKVKKFLEHLSLVHSNISLSLRDDSKNEIIFTIHKNRDTYQTLSSLYDIKKEDLQELQVEKNEYKVTAFLGKSDDDIVRHFIFLNGKFLDNSSKLHKLVNNNLSKYLHISRKIKTNIKDEENNLFHKIPCYFIFIKCPYIDYNLSNSPKQSVLEFKELDQVTKLLDKLIKFFKGDINLKVAEKIENNKEIHKGDSKTREQVKKIMEKILGSHTKKSGISNMHNGIKGKQIKRKVQKLLDTDKNNERNGKKSNNDKYTHYQRNKLRNNDKPDNIEPNTNHKLKELNKRNINNEPKNKNTKKYLKANCDKSRSGSHVTKSFNTEFKKVSNHNKIVTSKMKSKKEKLCHKINKPKITCKNKIINKFGMQTDSVKKRFKELDQKTKDQLNQLNKRKYEVLVNEEVQYRNISKNNFNVSIRKEIDEIVIHNYMPRQPKNIVVNDFIICNRIKNKAFHSNYDLLQTILKTQEDINVNGQVVDATNNSVAVMNQLRPRITDCKECKTLDAGVVKIPSEARATFQSHNYYNHGNDNTEFNAYYASCQDNQQTHNNDIRNLKKRPRTFITKQSTDNFILPNTLRNQCIFKKKYNRIGYSDQFKSNIKRLFRQTSKLFDMKNQIMGNTGASSYTIEFTQSNEYNVNDSKDGHVSVSPKETNMNIEERFTKSLRYSLHNNNNVSVNTNTFTISNTNKNGYTINDSDWNLYGTYTIERLSAKNFESETRNEDRNSRVENVPNNRNFIFISKSQKDDQNEEIIDPIHICETILEGKESFNGELEFRFNAMPNDSLNIGDHPGKLNDSLYTNNEQTFMSVQNDGLIKDIYPKEGRSIHNQEISRHFVLTTNNNVQANIDSGEQELRNPSPILTSRAQSIRQRVRQVIEPEVIGVKDSNLFNFNIKERPCFMPKGMSQIFENCHTKNACEYNLSADYYEDDMYNNFVDNVRNNAEIFEPKIREANELTTKALDKVNNKLNKDNSTLKFDGQSLKAAKVLGQIDEKFIAAIMKRGNKRKADPDFLVLFDQHAIHERIRLEQNLAEYFNENQWKLVTINEVRLKMSNDDILYLHNYKDKFEQLGLLWTVSNSNEVSISAIPEAILGKNPRQVDKVIKAVKSLITEEINIIKMQGGCFSLYPKSIMDLVFSEACRYAIMFGDKLSTNECKELLKMLSECKTPFQCAHGRPVMAVIMDIKTNTVEYKVNIKKIKEWKLNRR